MVLHKTVFRCGLAITVSITILYVLFSGSSRSRVNWTSRVDRNRTRLAEDVMDKILSKLPYCQNNFISSPFYDPTFVPPDWFINKFQMPDNSLLANKTLRLGQFPIQAGTLRSLISVLPQAFPENSFCKKCVVVGSSGVLRDKQLGKVIDSYPVVIRINHARMRGFHEMVGNRTDIRILYPESTPKGKQYYQGKGLVFSIFYKRRDIFWTHDSIMNKTILGNINDTKRVGLLKDASPNNWFVPNVKLHSILQQTIYNWSVPRGPKRPTIGTLGIYIALHICQQVDIAGFGYSLGKTKYLYYYMDRDLERGVNAISNDKSIHNTTLDTIFLTKLKCMKLLGDLTDGLPAC